MIQDSFISQRHITPKQNIKRFCSRSLRILLALLIYVTLNGIGGGVQQAYAAAGAYTLTVHIAPRGTMDTAPNGQTSPSAFGHMWYEISDGTTAGDVSYGFAPQTSNAPLGPGGISTTDTSSYSGAGIQTLSTAITQAQYNTLQTFGQTAQTVAQNGGGIVNGPNGVTFSTYYNGLTNSCIDFTWTGMSAIGIQKPT